MEMRCTSRLAVDDERAGKVRAGQSVSRRTISSAREKTLDSLIASTPLRTQVYEKVEVSNKEQFLTSISSTQKIQSARFRFMHLIMHVRNGYTQHDITRT